MNRWLPLLAILALTADPSAEPSQPQLPRGQMPDLGRPTKKEDTLPPFNFEQYFVGKWTFEWDVPETILGPGGRLTGTETVGPGVDGRFYTSTIEGTGPEGPVKITATMIYHAENKVVVRQEVDGRGRTLLLSGTMGGDLGGTYVIYYESAPFLQDGRTVRLKRTLSLTSPVHYKVRAQVSIDGAPFVNYGSPWWRKDVPGATEAGRKH